MHLTRRQLRYLEAVLQERQTSYPVDSPQYAAVWGTLRAHEQDLVPDEHADQGWSGLEELQETISEAIALGDRLGWRKNIRRAV